MAQSHPSKFTQLYFKIYEFFCGQHPNQRPWHFQWLAVKDLHADLRRVLPGLEGRVLDVGCGRKPYRPWLKNAQEYVGIDTTQWADVKIEYGQPWPLEDASFDSVICTQVLEHAGDFLHVLSEMARVLKPGGRLVVTVPFLYNEHGFPYDYRRFSVTGARATFEDQYDVLEVGKQGGFGSTIGFLWLNWLQRVIYSTKITRFLNGILMPLWILLSIIINAWGWLFDRLDRTGMFYSNVILVARKKS